MKFISAILILIMLFFLSPSVKAVENKASPILTELLILEAALENNPEIREAEIVIKSVKEIPSQAGSLDDPWLQFELSNMPTDTFSFSQENMTQKKVMISQRLPFPGKLGLKVRAAEENVEIATENLAEIKLKITKEVKQAHYKYNYLLYAIEIVEENKQMIKLFLSIAETKYSVGKGIQQDVLKAQVELSKIIDELIILNQSKESEQARLNVLMNKLPQEPMNVSRYLEQGEVEQSIEELQKLAVEQRPTLKKIKRLTERLKISKTLAEKEYYPNFNIGLKYGQRESNAMMERADFLSVFVGVNIPLWHKTKQSRKVAEESFKIDAVNETYNKQKNAIFLRIKQLMDDEHRGTERLLLIRLGIIPQSRQSLDAALAGYRVGKVDFLTLVDNLVTLFSWQKNYYKELHLYNHSLAELEYIVGQNLY